MIINNKQKIVIVTGLLLIAAAIIIWSASGAEIFTKTQVLVEKNDELLGTLYKEWKDQFVPGLDYTIVFTGIIALVSGIMIWKFKGVEKA